MDANATARPILVAIVEAEGEQRWHASQPVDPPPGLDAEGVAGHVEQLCRRWLDALGPGATVMIAAGEAEDMAIRARFRRVSVGDVDRFVRARILAAFPLEEQLNVQALGQDSEIYKAMRAWIEATRATGRTFKAMAEIPGDFAEAGDWPEPPAR